MSAPENNVATTGFWGRRESQYVIPLIGRYRAGIFLFKTPHFSDQRSPWRMNG
jgi:hypothetical protein